LGRLSYHVERNFIGELRYSRFAMHISTLFDLQEEELEDIILHEMIHYYILFHQLQDTSPHGNVFKSMVNEINHKFNRHITISYKPPKGRTLTDNRIKPHFFCLVKFKDGTWGITPIPHTRLFEYWELPKRFSNVKSYTWYISHNPYFNAFRKVLTFKSYKIDDIGKFQEYLNDARQLMREGNEICVKRKE